MKALDIIKLACDFTNNEELSSKLDEEDYTLSDSESKTIETLLKCLNLIQNEVACEYIPLAEIEEVEIKDFKVSYQQLSKNPISIVWVKDKFGRNIRFKEFSDHLVIFANKAKVKYFYMPDEINSLETEVSQLLLPMRIYAYGMAREYFLLQSLSDDADIWEVRFKDSLSVFARKKHEVKMPCRRWL